MKDQIAGFLERPWENKFAPCEDFTRKEFHQLLAKTTMILSSYSGNRALQIVLCESTYLILAIILIP